MSQYPDIGAGDDFTVEMLRSMIPNYIFKTSGESRASTTTIADDSDLIVPVEANAITDVKFIVHAAAILAADIKTAWSVPSGATGNRDVFGPGSTASDTAADNVAVRLGVHGFTTEITYSGVRNSNGAQFCIIESALVTTGATSGNVVFRWAQATSSATATIVQASHAIYRRVA